jgi:hypothetical protein
MRPVMRLSRCSVQDWAPTEKKFVFIDLGRESQVSLVICNAFDGTLKTTVGKAAFSEA